jgi:N-sulfoglucosamine sulfohydrolase
VLGELIAALDDPHPIVRYWGAQGCLILGDKAAPAVGGQSPDVSSPARDKLRAALTDELADVRIAAAEAIAHWGEADAALESLAGVLRSGGPYEKLAALNAIEGVWSSGHAPLARVQSLVKDLDLAEPADRIPRYLLGLK